MIKTALLIGNSKYPDDLLKNPVNDATGLQQMLSKLGFKCILLSDASIQDMDAALLPFSEQLKESDVGLFFFAGHGAQIEGTNYLQAINTTLADESNFKYSSLSLDKVIEIMKMGRNNTSIIILDACRNNPFNRTRGKGNVGLAQTFAPRGTLIAYATSPGETASDGKGNNGAYTDALLKHITTPDITVDVLFKRVRNTLSSVTKGRQTSWEHTSLMSDFYFNDSSVTSNTSLVYSKDALADIHYKGSTQESKQLMDDLTSHDWNRQNPAILRMTTKLLSHFNKDDLFVVGRNTYSTACGESFNAVRFVNSLSSSIERYGKAIYVHILNGMLYEIYYDSEGTFRRKPKTEHFEKIFSLELDHNFTSSFEFIRDALSRHLDHLFYVPLSNRTISIDVTSSKQSDGTHVIETMFFEGDIIMFDHADVDYFDSSNDDFLALITLTNLRENIAAATATPIQRLQITFPNMPASITEVRAPYYFNIHRIAF